jgi:replicative DNA helicase
MSDTDTNNNTALMTPIATPVMIEEYLEEWDRRRLNPGQFAGMFLGQKEFDMNVGGIEDGWYMLVGGPEKMGKTTFMMALATKFAVAGKKTAYFSLEMGKRQLSPKLISSLSGVEVMKFRQYQMTDGEWTKVKGVKETVSDWALDWYTESADFSDIVTAIIIGGYERVVVDYIQLLNSRQFASGGRQNEVAYISRTLKGLTRGKNDKERTIVVGSQLNNASIRLKSWDNQAYRDTGALAQDCDIAMMITPAIAPSGEEVPSMRQIKITASRHSDVFKFYIGFHGQFSRIDFGPQEFTTIASENDLNKIYKDAQSQPFKTAKGKSSDDANFYLNTDYNDDIPF